MHKSLIHDPCGAKRAEGTSGQLLPQGNDHDLQGLSFTGSLALPIGGMSHVTVVVGILPIFYCPLDDHLAKIIEHVVENSRKSEVL